VVKVDRHTLKSNILLLLAVSSLIKHVMIRGEYWPPAHDELVTTYLNAFSRFIKSIDFQKLQQTIRDHSAISDTYASSESVP
jgi:hypothetical protein